MNKNDVIEHEGKIAIVLARPYAHNDRPVLITALALSNIPAESYPQVIGLRFWSPNSNGYGAVTTAMGGTITIDSHDWQTVYVETPIAKPRVGKQYDWTYRLGEWMKDWFPVCRECNGLHSPDRSHCDYCGRAIFGGRCRCHSED